MARLGMTVPALLALAVMLMSLGETSSKGCCTSYSEKPFPVKLLQSYIKHGVQGACNIDAVIFTTKLGKKICANPKDKWVKRAIASIKNKNPS